MSDFFSSISTFAKTLAEEMVFFGETADAPDDYLIFKLKPRAQGFHAMYEGIVRKTLDWIFGPIEMVTMVVHRFLMQIVQIAIGFAILAALVFGGLFLFRFLTGGFHATPSDVNPPTVNQSPTPQPGATSGGSLPTANPDAPLGLGPTKAGEEPPSLARPRRGRHGVNPDDDRPTKAEIRAIRIALRQ